jgi:hypothetical protein
MCNFHVAIVNRFGGDPVTDKCTYIYTDCVEAPIEVRKRSLICIMYYKWMCKRIMIFKQVWIKKNISVWLVLLYIQDRTLKKILSCSRNSVMRLCKTDLSIPQKHSRWLTYRHFKLIVMLLVSSLFNLNTLFKLNT